MIFRNAGVPPSLFPGKPLVHLEAVVVPVGATLIVQSLPYRREPCFAVKFCLTGGSLLIYQGEPDFSPAKKCSLSGDGFSPRIYYPAIIRMVGPYFATATSARATCSSISGNITSAICFGPC